MRSLIGSHVLTSHLGKIHLAKLRPTHIEAWIVELRRKTRTVAGDRRRALSESSIARVFRVLSVVLDGAVRDGRLAANPTHKVARLSAERAEARVLSAAEVVAILHAARDMDADPKGHRSHNHALFATIAATGMRKGEALALRWADVDFDKGTITIRGTLSRVNGELVVTTPKTAKSRRVLTPAEGVMRLLRAHRVAQIEDRLHAGDQWRDSGHIFTTGIGSPRDPRGVLRSMVAAARRAGVDDVHVHSLRHTAATAMLEQGIHVKAVSELLGHAGTQITTDVYAHLTSPTAKKALDGLGAAIGL
jgi:integrase